MICKTPPLDEKVIAAGLYDSFKRLADIKDNFFLSCTKCCGDTNSLQIEWPAKRNPGLATKHFTI